MALDKIKFPFEEHEQRLERYAVFDEMLAGKHFDAFSLRGGNNFAEAYERLRYIVFNFSGLIAKVSADMLFGEEISIHSDNNQEWLTSLYEENNLRTQFFESALSNAALGDSDFKIRIGNRANTDGEIIIEEFNPAIYFPVVNPANARAGVIIDRLAWVVSVGKDNYLIQEDNGAGYVETRVFKLIGEKETFFIDEEIDVKEFNAMSGMQIEPYIETGIDRSLVFHVPNYRQRGNKSIWGVSDFTDILTLQYEGNNRLTKIANVLDKHTDPILAVPDGVLDENGQVRRESFNMIEVGVDGKSPEYIVWNANLESAFSEIDKLIEMMFMVSETSPDVMGLGKGNAESGRALKMRLIRTIAKISRKRLYYDQAIKDMFMTAQELSQVNGWTVAGERVPFEPEPVEISWSDGIVNDRFEETQIAAMEIEAGIKSKETVMRELNGWGDEMVAQELEKVNEGRADFQSILDANQLSNNG